MTHTSTAILFALCLSAVGSVAQAQSAPQTSTADAYVSKKDKRLQDKAQAAPFTPAEKRKRFKYLKKRLRKLPMRVVNIYNKWTHETLVFNSWDVRKPPKELTDKFLRCHFTNQPTDMDPRLFVVLLKAAQHFHVQKIDVVSGFRDPKYNLSLRKKGRQVARNSEHTQGHAVDFRLPGVSIDALHEWARSLRLGGVGFYKSSRFIHVDVGNVRYWNGT